MVAKKTIKTVMVREMMSYYFVVQVDDHRDLATINELVQKRTEAVKAGPAFSRSPPLLSNNMTYEVMGSIDDIVRCQKIIRRLSRGKPRFTVWW